MHLDETGLTKLWTKIRNYLSRKLNLKADKSDTYTKNEIHGLLMDQTDGYLYGSIEEVRDSETGVTLRKFLFGSNSFYMERQEVTYYNNLAVYFPTNTGRSDAPIFILCTLSDCGSTSWREGRTPTASSAAASTTRSLSPSRGRPRPATSQTRYRFRFSGGIYNFFHVIYLKVRGFMFLINDILDEVLNDFKNFVENSDSLCELKDLRFDGGHTPDYSNQHIQQYYLLRYAYAYAFEYKWMYGKLLHSNYKTLPEKINILSLGTGSMLDYWAISQLLQGRKQVNYKGVDVIDWKYKIEAENDDKVEFINKDIVSYFKDFSSDTDFNPDIYIFPNSISELNPDDIGKICDQVQEKICEKDKVYFMFSLRTDEDSMNIDMKRTGLIYDALIEKGFITKDKRDVYFSIIDESQDKKIYEVDNSFCQPANVISYLVNLSNKCNDLKENKCNDNCLDRWPILKCRYMKYQIFSFEREG